MSTNLVKVIKTLGYHFLHPCDKEVNYQDFSVIITAGECGQETVAVLKYTRSSINLEVEIFEGKGDTIEEALNELLHDAARRVKDDAKFYKNRLSQVRNRT